MTKHPEDRLEQITHQLEQLTIDPTIDVEVEITASTGEAEKAFAKFYKHAVIDMLWATSEIYRLRREKLRLMSEAHDLVRHGTGTELSPTLSEEKDTIWWYDQIRELDQQWRDRVEQMVFLRD
jgi:hypothetical protein